MKKEKLVQALDEISPKHIAEAASAKKKRRGLTRIAAIAAILALVLLIKNVEVPVVITAQAVSRASGAKRLSAPILLWKWSTRPNTTRPGSNGVKRTTP